MDIKSCRTTKAQSQASSRTGVQIPYLRSGTFHTDKSSKCEPSSHGSYNSCRGCRRYDVHVRLRPLRTKEVEGVDSDGRQVNEGELGNSLRRATGESFGTTNMSLQGKWYECLPTLIKVRHSRHFPALLQGSLAKDLPRSALQLARRSIAA